MMYHYCEQSQTRGSVSCTLTCILSEHVQLLCEIYEFNTISVFFALQIAKINIFLKERIAKQFFITFDFLM